jgi:hypothetical protein
MKTLALALLALHQDADLDAIRKKFEAAPSRRRATASTSWTRS